MKPWTTCYLTESLILEEDIINKKRIPSSYDERNNSIHVQFMPQNIQDLGLFEDLSCRNDFSNIPDVDMTFQNFEELFRGDQDPMRGLLTSENDLSCSSLDREISFDKSENSHAPAVEV